MGKKGGREGRKMEGERSSPGQAHLQHNFTEVHWCLPKAQLQQLHIADLPGKTVSEGACVTFRHPTPLRRHPQADEAPSLEEPGRLGTEQRTQTEGEVGGPPSAPCRQRRADSAPWRPSGEPRDDGSYRSGLKLNWCSRRSASRERYSLMKRSLLP